MEQDLELDPELRAALEQFKKQQSTVVPTGQISTAQAVGTATSPKTAGAGTMVDYYAKADTARNAAYDKAQPSDAELQAAQQSAGQGATAGIGLMALGGESLAPAGQAMLQKALAAQAKFAPDPFKRAESAAKKLEAEAAAWDRRAATAGTLEERHFATEQANQLKQLLLSSQFANQEANRDLRRELGGQAAEQRAATAAQGNEFRTAQGEDRLKSHFDTITKDLRDEIAATGKIKQIITPGKALNAQEQQAAVYLLNKFLDPGSVVREGEFARSGQMQGLMQKAATILPKLKEGVFLAPETVKQIGELADVYSKAANERAKATAEPYIKTARERKWNPENVVTNPAWHPSPVAAPAAPTAARKYNPQTGKIE